MRALYQMGIINGIIVPRELYLGHSSLIKQMAINGIDVQDIYLTKRIIDKEIRMDDWFTFLQPYLSTKYLPYLEYHIADHCNLNCKACEHYSGLVSEPHYPDLEKFSSDLCKLHEFIDDIGTIRILGGEPLSQYNLFLTAMIIQTVKEHLPQVSIWIWSGYNIEEILAMTTPHLKLILSKIDAIVAGPYVESLRDITLPFRGSSNQKVFLFDHEKNICYNKENENEEYKLNV